MRPRQDWKPYVDALAARMRLSHWTFKISEDAPGGELSVAAVEPWRGRHVATIYLSDRFLGASPEDQRYTIVHELAHCFFAHANAIILDDLSKADERAWRLAHEYGVDQIASLIAPTMPLPDIEAPEGIPRCVADEYLRGDPFIRNMFDPRDKDPTLEAATNP